MAPRLADFSDLAELASRNGGRLSLSGAEEGLAGLQAADFEGAEFEAAFVSFSPNANALSFCVDNVTFTLMEDPDDGYRSALGAIIRREGNHCKNQFPPVPLGLRFVSSTGPGCAPIEGDLIAASREANLFELFDEGAQTDEERSAEVALCAGTDYTDDYYPCCVTYFSPESLTAAFARAEARAINQSAQPGAAGRPRGLSYFL